MRLLRCCSFVLTGWLLVVAGCAPAGSVERAITVYADEFGVRDAAARRTSAAWYLRFDSLSVSDLREAVGEQNQAAVRREAAAALRAAARLGSKVRAEEIDRMPPRVQKQLARLAEIEPDVEVVNRYFDRRAAAALAYDLDDVETLPIALLRRKLNGVWAGIEPLPDDRGRLGRQIMLAWAAIPSWMGVNDEEAKLPGKIEAKVARRVDRIALWQPDVSKKDDALSRYAPIIAVDWPEHRRYPERDDRIGAVRLSGASFNVEVHVDPKEPVVYAYTSEAKIGKKRLRQCVYVWWFPERPAMSKDDPVAGHIDGGMLRLTLNAKRQPVIVESSLNCGCGHQVFVSKALEAAARRMYGRPLPNKRFAIEKHIPGKHDVVVVDTFDLPSAQRHPVIDLAAGYHEVYRVGFSVPSAADGVHVIETASYALRDYDELTTLPLGKGVASMFGPDGLVHHAGRPEGYLLAPTGMLSAGQPRQRGTHRVRWDDFLFDDPHLLERTLRLPSDL